MTMFGDDFGIRSVGSAMGGNGGAQNIFEWDSDLANTAALLAMLEWDSSFAVGATQAEAEAALTVNAGDMEIDTGAAVTAGADADFKARWWITEKFLAQMNFDLRAERIATGTNATTPHAIIRWCAHHFASDAAANPSTPSDFGLYSDSWIGIELRSHNANFSTARGIYDSTPTSTLVSDFLRFHADLYRSNEIVGTFTTPLILHAGATYALSTNTASTSDGQRGIGDKFADSRRFRFALEIDPEAGAAMGVGGADRMQVRIPRFRLNVLTP
jgi:hypothetical protein